MPIAQAPLDSAFKNWVHFRLTQTSLSPPIPVPVQLQPEKAYSHQLLFLAMNAHPFTMQGLFALTAVLLAAPQGLFAQVKKADYERAANLRRDADGKLRKGGVEANWSPDGNRFWYRNTLTDDRNEFVFVDAAKGERKVVLPADVVPRLATALSGALGKEVAAKDLQLKALELNSDGTLLLKFEGKSFSFNASTGALAPHAPDLADALANRKGDGPGPGSSYPGPQNQSPDRAWQVEMTDGKLMVKPASGGEAIALTKDEKLEGVRIFWAPDSKRFALMHSIPGEKRTVHAVDSSPADQVQPKLKSWGYTKPGDRIALTKVRLFGVNPSREIPVAADLFSNPWHIDRMRWEADSSSFTFLYNQRGHQVMRIVSVNAEDGSARALIEDTPKTFFNYFAKLFVQFHDPRSEVIWMSERDGWNHLYLFDSHTGKLKNQITKGEWVVRDVDWVDTEKRQIWFRAGGINPAEDPYHIHFCRINFDGSGLVRLTTSDGNHDIRYSPDRRFFIDRYSRVDLPPVHELRRTDDGGLVCELEKADISLLQKIPGWSMPERFVAKGRDGTTDIWGIIHRPSNLDPAKKYPVVEKIYAGPHGNYVPKKFFEYLTAMDIAELGFIVVVIDGMGTNWRSKAFHDVCWQNLKDAGFPDRIPWIKAAAAKYSWIDATRVGIYGGSAGGQNALGALLFHPDFYHVAVADCGCHDNRVDKIHWNEAWMGLMGPHYAENSNVTHAHKLQGKLFLTVGELDTNVDPASTMQVVNALVVAGKDFDMCVVPGAGHGVGETPYLRRRREDFFVRHLYGVEPRRE